MDKLLILIWITLFLANAQMFIMPFNNPMRYFGFIAWIIVIIMVFIR